MPTKSYMDSIAEVKAKTGQVLIFNHNLKHDGSTVKDGVKYIMKSEIIFRRTDKYSCPPSKLVS